MYKILMVLVLVSGCETFGDNEVPEVQQTETSLEQCQEVMDLFCAKATACDNATDNVVQCSEVTAKACGLNKTVLAPKAQGVCTLNLKLAGCNGKKLEMNPAATSCVSIFSAWTE